MLTDIESQLMAEGRCYCGVDEAGAGPLCGDVLAAAVILDPLRPIDGLDDSKKLTAKRRERLFDLIMDQALAVSVARATVEEIDRINILKARMLAMSRAVTGLALSIDHVLVDGNRLPELHTPATAIVKGDSLVKSIAAASIVAKVTRDREMLVMDQLYPGYGFAVHKGYGTKAHMDALQRLGPAPIHRRSYAPIKALLEQMSSSKT